MGYPYQCWALLVNRTNYISTTSFTLSQVMSSLSCVSSSWYSSRCTSSQSNELSLMVLTMLCCHAYFKTWSCLNRSAPRRDQWSVATSAPAENKRSHGTDVAGIAQTSFVIHASVGYCLEWAWSHLGTEVKKKKYQRQTAHHPMMSVYLVTSSAISVRYQHNYSFHPPLFARIDFCSWWQRWQSNSDSRGREGTGSLVVVLIVLLSAKSTWSCQYSSRVLLTTLNALSHQSLALGCPLPIPSSVLQGHARPSQCTLTCSMDAILYYV